MPKPKIQFSNFDVTATKITVWQRRAGKAYGLGVPQRRLVQPLAVAAGPAQPVGSVRRCHPRPIDVGPETV